MSLRFWLPVVQNPESKQAMSEDYPVDSKSSEALPMREEETRRLNPATVPSQQHEPPVPLTLEVTSSHRYLKPSESPQAFYTLISVRHPERHSEESPADRTPLNLCLLLDRSTSMKGDRLHQVKAASKQIIDSLLPTDYFSLVAFNDRPEAVVPSGCGVEPALTKAMVSTIQAAGGTEILQGLLAAREQLRKGHAQGRLDHLVLLTDGHTYGDERPCLNLARWAGSKAIGITTIGIGADWNERFLDQLAVISGGTSYYVADVMDIPRILGAILMQLRTVTIPSLTLTIEPYPAAHVVEIFQVSPVLTHLPIESLPITVTLGTMTAGEKRAVLVEYHVTSSQLGQTPIAQVSATAQMLSSRNQCQPTRQAIDAEFSTAAQTANTPVPSTIVSAMRRVTLLKLQEKASADIISGNINAAQERLDAVATQLLDLGQAELAQVAANQAAHVAHTQALSTEASKQLHYGTRALSPFDSKEGGQ